MVLITLTSILSLLAVGNPIYEFVTSIRQSSAAQTVVTYAETDRSLFLSRTDFRFEWGYSGVALAADPEANRAQHKDLIAGRRPQLDRSVAAAIAALSASPDPAVQLAARDLVERIDAWKSLRPDLDGALGMPIAERDDRLRTRVAELGSEITKRLEAAAALLEKQIRTLDPSTGSLLDANAAIWLARTNSGTEGATAYNALVMRKPATDGERDTVRATRMRAATAWTMAGQILSATDVPATVTAAYRTASEGYFDGPFNHLRTKLIGTVVDGTTTPAAADDEIKTWQQGQVMGLVLIDETAIAIMKAVGEEAGLRARAATMRFRIFLGIALVASALSIAAAWIIHFRVALGIVRLAGAMRAIAEGAAETTIPGFGRSDEIGAMATAVHVFKDNLIRTRRLEADADDARRTAEDQRRTGMRQMAETFEAAVGGIIGHVSAAALELHLAAQTMTATAAETASQSSTAAIAAGQAASNVSTVAAAAEELGSSVQEIGRQVQGSAELARSAAGEADETGARVQDLSRAVSRIGDVAGLISAIAGQTNLLALNATIEAARAGEAGRGFAVVAAEVKALAEQTARATHEISGQIAQVQTSTGGAVSAIGAITARIREINGVSASVAAAVEEQGAATQEIVRNVGQAAAGTGAVTSTIAGVAGAAEATGAAASRVLGAASALSRQADHLTAEVGRFLANVRASYAISASQVMLVRNSFAKVQLIADTAADLFYARLFELAPPVRRLFPADMTAQKRKLIAMLGLAVANLDTPEAFVAAVTELGRRHVAYGTVAAHFEPVGAALLWTLEQGLGPDFSPELRQAWSETFDIVASVMQSAADARAA